MSARPVEYSISPVDTYRDRRPPYSEDAETAVLGAILLDERALLVALELIDDTMFYAERHRRIFRAMTALAEKGGKIDPLTVSEELARRGELEASGGKDYVYVRLADSVPFATNVADHARIVREKSDLRRLIERAQSAVADAFQGERSASELAAELQRDVLGLSIDATRAGFVRVKEDIWSVMEDIEAAARTGNRPRVIPTGYREIDDNISGGFERGHFIILAGVPGSAKTAVALNIALNVALEGGIGVAFVSAEMTRAQLIKRSLANISHVPLSVIRSGKLQDSDFPRIARGAGILSAMPLWVDQTPSPDIDAILAKCRKEKAEHPEIGLLIVDFIQLVQKRHAKERRGRGDENRSAELTTISYALQGLAKDLDVAVIATSQVDAAAIENRPDKRPKLGEARWSQGMREAAHLFATVYRPKMYDPDAFDTIELSFQKGRDDPPFTAVFDWIGHHMLMKARPATGYRP